MKIGIIGAGQIGGALARRLTALHHEVVIANSRGPESLRDLVAETGATAAHTADVVRGVDLIVLTIQMKKVESLPKDLFAQVPASVPVIDTNNYYPRERDGRIEAIEAGSIESRWVEQQIGRPVIKAFNNIYAQHLLELGKPKGTPGRIALPVSGDDASCQGEGHGPGRRAWLRPGRCRRAGRVLAPAAWLACLPRTMTSRGCARLWRRRRERTPQWSGTASPGTFQNPA